MVETADDFDRHDNKCDSAHYEKDVVEANGMSYIIHVEVTHVHADAKCYIQVELTDKVNRPGPEEATAFRASP